MGDQQYKLDRTQFFVEANRFEQFSLWQEYHKELDWVEDNQGFMHLCGTINSGNETLPVYVDFSFAKINNKYICFYYGCSRGIDHKLIEDYIETYPVKWDNGTRRAMTDADNFHHCVNFIQNE